MHRNQLKSSSAAPHVTESVTILGYSIPTFSVELTIFSSPVIQTFVF
jgi:hypothetical protein